MSFMNYVINLNEENEGSLKWFLDRHQVLSDLDEIYNLVRGVLKYDNNAEKALEQVLNIASRYQEVSL